MAAAKHVTFSLISFGINIVRPPHVNIGTSSITKLPLSKGQNLRRYLIHGKTYFYYVITGQSGLIRSHLNSANSVKVIQGKLNVNDQVLWNMIQTHSFCKQMNSIIALVMNLSWEVRTANWMINKEANGTSGMKAGDEMTCKYLFYNSGMHASSYRWGNDAPKSHRLQC